MTEETLLVKICTFLGVTVLLNTFFDKFPQIYNIVHSGSSAGVSLLSNFLEMIGYTGMLTYQFAKGYPFHTFMENITMVFQDWLLLAVILVNRKEIGNWLTPYITVYFVFFTFVGMYWLPDPVMYFVAGVTTPILCWSKLNQLVKILMRGDAGQLSSITWFLVCYDTAVRMLTTAVITKDIPMFVNLTTSEVLNLSIFFSIIYFNYIKKPLPRRRRSSRY